MAKLIRDNIPLVALSEGRVLNTCALNDSEYQQALHAKLQEESIEAVVALQSGDQDNIPSELADVYEVLISLADSYGVDLESVAAEKRQLLGSFKNRTYWVDE